MGTYGGWQALIFLVWLVVFFAPCVLIVRKAGYSGWLALVGLIPIVNLIALWVFACVRWPVEGPLTGDAALAARATTGRDVGNG